MDPEAEASIQPDASDPTNASSSGTLPGDSIQQPPASTAESMEGDPDPSDTRITPPIIPAVPQATQQASTDTTTLPPPTAIPVEPRIPQKKDTTLRAFLSQMDDYAPLIPDAVTDHYLTLAGLPPPPQTDRRLARLLALATQKFLADVAADAYQYSRIRSTNTTSNNPLSGLGGAAGFGAGMGAGGGGEGEGGGGGKGKKGEGKAAQAALGGPRAGFGGGGAGGGQGRTVLTMEDLGMAVGEYGVNVRRGEFYR